MSKFSILIFCRSSIPWSGQIHHPDATTGPKSLHPAQIVPLEISAQPCFP